MFAKFFLRANHWQIFILVFGVYFVGQMALVGSILASPRSQEVFSKGGLVGGLVMMLSTLGLFVWFWSMGSFFNSIVQPGLRMKSAFFRVALIYPPCYFVFFIATFQSSSPGLFGLILPLHLFAMVCIFYLLYFVLRTSYWQRPVNQRHSTIMQVHFFSSGFSPLVSGLSSRGSIDFTQRERTPNPIEPGGYVLAAKPPNRCWEAGLSPANWAQCQDRGRGEARSEVGSYIGVR